MWEWEALPENERRDFTCGIVWGSLEDLSLNKQCFGSLGSRYKGVPQCPPYCGDSHMREFRAVFFVEHFYPTCQNFLFMLSLFLQQKTGES